VATQFSLTAAARRDIAAILRHSTRTFGSVQRQIYSDLIQQTLHRIADEPLGIGSKSCEALRAGLRSLRIARIANRQSAAAHVVYYSASQVGGIWSVTVVRILHDRMDPERHITGELG
jgi:toxin ParE1/3/4